MGQRKQWSETDAERQAWPSPPSLCGPIAPLGPNLRLVSAPLRTTPFRTEAAVLALTEDSSRAQGPRRAASANG